MVLLGTHNSVSGESKGWLGKMLRTQKLSIIEQAKSGIQYFEIKIRRIEDTWFCTNGTVVIKKTLQQVLSEIAQNTPHQSILLSVSYDGTLPHDISEQGFVKFLKKSIKRYPVLTLFSVAEEQKRVSWKKTVWNRIWKRNTHETINVYPELSGWKKLLPFPWLWKREGELSNPNPDNNNVILIVDFYDGQIS